MMKTNVLIVGGGGYVGTKLTASLVDKKYIVTVLDTFWFGDFLPQNPNIIKVVGDIRDNKVVAEACKNKDVLILLSCLSNDPMSDINPELTQQINLAAVSNVIKIAKLNKIKRIIYASSASVYGLQDVEKVTEEIQVKPLTLYSRYKAEVEKLLYELADDAFEVVTVRSSTVCGFSPRIRLDLLVNLFSFHALKNKVIYLEGGQQIRPLIHINDLVEFYTMLIELDKKLIHNEVFNVSSGNYKVADVAKLVQEKIECDIKFSEVTDFRSYPLCVDKVEEKLGFKTKFTVEEAIVELKEILSKNTLQFDIPLNYNLKQMKLLVDQNKVQLF